MAKIDHLLPQAAEIRDAMQEGENTALRVGTMFVDLIQALEEILSSDDETKTVALKAIRQEIVTEASTRAAADSRIEQMCNSLRADFGTEASERANADNELRAALALLKDSVITNSENIDGLTEKQNDLRIEMVYLVMRLDGITDGIPDSAGAAASRRYYFDRESKQFYFTDDYQVGIFNRGLQRLFLVGDDLYIFIDNDLKLIHAAPIEVESEEAMAGLIASGKIDDNRMYYITESD